MYACDRLFGSYEALEGGMMGDALVDFTGGVGYRVDLKWKHNLPEDFFRRLQTLDNMSTLMGCSINASPHHLHTFCDLFFSFLSG